MICGIKKVESTHGTPPATRLASNAAQPLKIIYHRKQKLSNGFLVVVLVYASQINIILIVLKPIVSPQETYPYIQSPFPASSNVHTDYSNIYK